MLITGTSRGIGRYLAEHYARQGVQVFGCSRGDADLDLDGYDHTRLDVSDEAAAKRLFSRIRKDWGRLDVLINNAGISATNHSLLTPVETVHDVLSTNVVGTFLFSREAAKLMRGNDFGRIVNLATVVTPLKLEGEAAYAASKAAVVSLTQILARELVDFGITVNAVGPTPIETDFVRGRSEGQIDSILQRLAIKRLGRLEDVSNVIDFFIKPESDAVTGQVVYLGGA
jgi:3-oxoacyl-[acyl-carrier protein] reductase